jgi:CheY-like chemotaxis protein
MADFDYKKKIVVVEDDPDILISVSMILENAGYEVARFSSGQPLLERAYQIPDLFILDKRIPHIDGLDLCRHLKNRPETKDIPVIIISASPKFGTQALKAGANAFLAKPFQMSTLVRMVEQHIPAAT